MTLCLFLSFFFKIFLPRRLRGWGATSKPNHWLPSKDNKEARERTLLASWPVLLLSHHQRVNGPSADQPSLRCRLQTALLLHASRSWDWGGGRGFDWRPREDRCLDLVSPARRTLENAPVHVGGAEVVSLFRLSVSPLNHGGKMFEFRHSGMISCVSFCVDNNAAIHNPNLSQGKLV